MIKSSFKHYLNRVERKAVNGNFPYIVLYGIMLAALVLFVVAAIFIYFVLLGIGLNLIASTTGAVGLLLAGVPFAIWSFLVFFGAVMKLIYGE